MPAVLEWPEAGSCPSARSGAANVIVRSSSQPEPQRQRPLRPEQPRAPRAGPAGSSSRSTGRSEATTSTSSSSSLLERGRPLEREPSTRKPGRPHRAPARAPATARTGLRRRPARVAGSRARGEEEERGEARVRRHAGATPRGVIPPAGAVSSAAGVGTLSSTSRTMSSPGSPLHPELRPEHQPVSERGRRRRPSRRPGSRSRGPPSAALAARETLALTPPVLGSRSTG